MFGRDEELQGGYGSDMEMGQMAEYDEPNWWEKIFGSMNPNVHTPGEYADNMEKWSPVLEMLGSPMRNPYDNIPTSATGQVPDEREMRERQQMELFGALGRGLGNAFAPDNSPVRRHVYPTT